MIDVQFAAQPTPAPTPPAAPATAAGSPGYWTIHVVKPTAGQLVALRWFAVVLALVLYHSGGFPSVRWPFGPRPVTAPLHATLVVDTDSSDPHVTGADVTAGAGPEEALKALNCAWREYDKDSPTLASRKLTPYATKAGLPALIVQAEGTPAPIVAVPAPTSAAGVVDVIKKIRGVK